MENFECTIPLSVFADSVGGAIGMFSDFLSTIDEDFSKMWMIGMGDYPNY